MKKINKGRIATVAAGAVALAVFGGGTAVAGSLITSAQIKDNTIVSADVKEGSLKGNDIKNSSLKGEDVVNGGLTGDDIKNGTLSSEDLGLHFASVNQDGALDNSSGGVSVTRINAGQYSVDFGFDVRKCAFSVTKGGISVGNATGQANASDKSNNAEAVLVWTTDSTGNFVDGDFHLLVFC